MQEQNAYSSGLFAKNRRLSQIRPEPLIRRHQQMAAKQRKKKPRARVKITASVLVGLMMGFLLIVGGLYQSLVQGGYFGYYAVALGICFMGLVVLIHWGCRG